MASEKQRLVYANEVSERADEVTFMGFMAKDRKQHLLDLVSAILENIPTVDAVEVVHGRWQLQRYYSGMRKGMVARIVCSECGYPNEETNYCPNCGAKMDGDGNA